MQHALSETPAILKTLEDYFAFGYPFDKLDLLAAPDFAAGAMENPGLITFRDHLMLLDKDSPVSFVTEFIITSMHMSWRINGSVMWSRCRGGMIYGSMNLFCYMDAK